ncbi:MAG: hypothetical protein J0L92_35735 [Deltaproteobacteria bacterium]|nr:hypothetical protein [Deltaproteobacteria bacterium]
MQLLYESKHARLEIDAAKRLIRYTRSAEPFASLAEAERMFHELGAANVGIDRGELALLSDIRLAPGRNDEAFEGAVASHRHELFGGFKRRATLVRTLVGKLQVQRLNRSSILATEVFDDEAAAIAYLLAP